jgi:hypothetical protein
MSVNIQTEVDALDWPRNTKPTTDFFPRTTKMEDPSSTETVDHKGLSVACPGIDFTVPYKIYHTSLTIGDYIGRYLVKTFEIIKSSPCMDATAKTGTPNSY